MVSHAGSINAYPTTANVKAPAHSDSPLTIAQMTLLSIPELVGEEVHAWIERERRQRPGVTNGMLMDLLARALGLTNARQVYRYMSGETPFPLEKAALFCRLMSSWRLLQLVNQDAGLLVEPKPDAGKIDGFDLIVEQSHNLKEFGELVAVFASATEKVASDTELQRIEKEGREAIQQIERLMCIYRELAAHQVKT